MTRGDARSWLLGSLRAEMRKLRSHRALRGIAAAIVMLSAGFAALLVAGPVEDGLGDPVVRTGLAMFTGYSLVPYLAAFLGCVAVTGEFGSGVSTALYSWMPSRWPVVVAKALVFAAVGVCLAGLSLAGAAAGIAVTGGASSFLGSGMGAAMSGAVLAAGLMAVIGVAVGALVRRTSLGAVMLVMLLGVLPVLLGSLGAVWPAAGTAAGLLPMSATNALYDFGTAGAGLAAPAVAALALLTWAVAGLASSLAVLARADL